jgi:hypothetical protein
VLRSVTGKRTSASTMTMMGRNHSASIISMAAWAQCARPGGQSLLRPITEISESARGRCRWSPAGGIVADDATLVRDGDGRWEL